MNPLRPTPLDEWRARLNAMPYEQMMAWIAWFSASDYSLADDDGVRFHDLNEDGTE